MPDAVQTILAVNGTLSAEQPSVSLGRPFDSSEEELFDSLVVGQTLAYDNFGALNSLQPDLTRFFSELGNDAQSARDAAKSVTRFVQNCLIGLSAETAWITLRASTPMHNFDIPRWHRDCYYYTPYNGEPRKVVLTLKGRERVSTCFHWQTSPASTICRASCRTTIPEREIKIATLVGEAHGSQAATREPYLYLTGCNHAAIHSEPPIHEDRLFMSIVPGSTFQIADLRQSWERKQTSYS